ncbi:ATP-binding protein [bacterium]|nr:ATP-binding protein [bacterium]
MKRKIYRQLVAWKAGSAGRQALLIEGARRIGKSYIVRQFATEAYQSCVWIDFTKVDETVKNIFNNYLTHLDDFFLLLSNYYQINLFPRQTIFVFDEVQNFPRAREAIKTLVEDGRFDYIETGSLISLRQNVQNILIPSGERKIAMYPFDFEEFLWARGDNSLMQLITQYFERREAIPAALHRRALDRWREYLIVGGMPESIATYIQTRDFVAVDAIKRDIIGLYRDDIRKFAAGLNLKAERFFDDIPGQLNSLDKKFTWTSLGDNARFRDYESALVWLDDAKLINPCYNTFEPNIGLHFHRDSSDFKCFLGDTGLLLSLAFDSETLFQEAIYRKILFDKLTFNYGMIVENAVAQMLVASGHRLYYYKRNDREDTDNNMEVDFLLTKRGVTSRHNIIPIEVKSGQKITLTSLTKFRKKFRNYASKPVVLYPGELRDEQEATYLPLYMTPCL